MTETSAAALGTAYELGSRPAQKPILGRIEGGTEPMMRGVEILNPWGRPMPRIKRPRYVKPTHQIYVTDRQNRLIPISPVMPFDMCLSAFEGAKKGAALGRGIWREWGNPQILPVTGLPASPQGV